MKLKAAKPPRRESGTGGKRASWQQSCKGKHGEFLTSSKMLRVSLPKETDFPLVWILKAIYKRNVLRWWPKFYYWFAKKERKKKVPFSISTFSISPKFNHNAVRPFSKVLFYILVFCFYYLTQYKAEAQKKHREMDFDISF